MCGHSGTVGRNKGSEEKCLCRCRNAHSQFQRGRIITCSQFPFSLHYEDIYPSVTFLLSQLPPWNRKHITLLTSRLSALELSCVCCTGGCCLTLSLCLICRNVCSQGMWKRPGAGNMSFLWTWTNIHWALQRHEPLSALHTLPFR